MKVSKAVLAFSLGLLSSAALYPQNSDTPSLQPGALIPANNSPSAFGDKFGQQIDISGDTIIVGVPDKQSSPSEGLVYFFRRNLGDDGTSTVLDNWGQLPPEPSTLASVSTPISGYGASVAIDGNTAVAATSSYTDGNGDTYGAVEVFRRNGNTGGGAWDRLAFILDPDKDSSASFGASVAICNDHVIVGAPGKGTSGTNNGVAYVFERNQGGENDYDLVATLSDPLGGDDHFFGSAVAISDEFAAVSAPGDQGANSFSGLVVVFQRNRWDFGQSAIPSADNWGLEARIGSPNAYDEFGHSLALEDDTLVVGQRFHSLNGADSGAAFVYQRQKPGSVGIWQKVADLFVPGFNGGEWLGDSVDISQDIVVVGAPRDESIHLFHRNTGGPNAWGLAGSESSSNFSDFGDAVAIDGHTVVGGSPGYAVSAEIAGGRIEIHNLEGKEWVATLPELSARHSVAIDELESLGEDLAIWGDTAIVGGRGFAYILRRNHNHDDPATPEYEEWGLIKKLTAPMGSDADVFGRRVALSQGYAAVADESDVNLYDRDYDPASPGTVSEDAWGFRQQKNLAPFPDEDVGDIALFKDTLLVGIPMQNDPGQALIFYQNEGGADNWGQIATLAASGGVNGDDFGAAVDLQNDFAIIGAPEHNDEGAAYLFERNEGPASDSSDDWGQIDSLQPTDTTVRFGVSVAIDEDFAAVGDSGFRVSPFTSQPGKVHIFQRQSAGNWDKVKDLSGTVPALHDLFGYSLAMRHEKLVVGSPGHDRTFLPDMGLIYVFQRNLGGADNWGLEWQVPDWHPEANGQFGAAVATNGVHMLVGEPNDLIVDSNIDSPDYDSAGEVSIYRWDWTPYWDWADTHFSAGTLADPLTYETMWGPKADPDDDDIDNLWEEITDSDPLITAEGWPRMPRSFDLSGNRGIEMDHLPPVSFPADLRLRVRFSSSLGNPIGWMQAGVLGRSADWEVETGFVQDDGAASGNVQETRFYKTTAGSMGFFQFTLQRR